MDRIDPSSISSMAETVGVNVSASACVAVSHDVTFRLKQLLQTSTLFMRVAKRSKLSVDDINRALKWHKHPVLHGHANSDPVRMVHVEEAGVFVTDETSTPVLDIALDSLSFVPDEGNRVNSTWLTSRRTLPLTDVSLEKQDSTDRIESENFSKRNSDGEFDFDSEDEAEAEEEEQAEEEEEEEEENDELLLPDDLTRYYHAVVRLICSTEQVDEEGAKEVLNDLRSNPDLSLLVSPFVRFFEEGLEEKDNSMFVMNLLHLMDALLSNPHVVIQNRGCGESIAATIVERLLNPVPADDWSPLALHIRSKALLVLQKVLHAPSRGPPMDETVVRDRLMTCYERGEDSFQDVANVLSVFSCFSPTILLSEEYFRTTLTSFFPASEDEWELPALDDKEWLPETAEALKACYYSVYKHVIDDAAREIIVGPTMQEISLDVCESPSSCELLTDWLNPALELFGDGFLHLLLPLQLPREPTKVIPRAPKCHPFRIIRLTSFELRASREAGARASKRSLPVDEVFEVVPAKRMRREVGPVTATFGGSRDRVKFVIPGREGLGRRDYPRRTRFRTEFVVVGKQRGTKCSSTAMPQSCLSYGLYYYWL